MSRFALHCGRIAGQLLLSATLFVAGTSRGIAQQAAPGPFEKLMDAQLGPVEILIILIASLTTMVIATREFASGQVTVLDLPTMPKYTVPRLSFWSFCLLYVIIVFALFIVVMERYGVLRQLLIGQNDAFAALPSGADVLTISVGSVAVIVVLHYLRIPNTQIGPSWLLFMLRQALHKRARIPDEAQALAAQLLSDNPRTFTVPRERIGEVLNTSGVRSVSAGDFEANRSSVDYQWAIVSYFYSAGRQVESVPPYSSFVSNSASLWPDIVSSYNELANWVTIIKQGGSDDATQNDVRRKINELRVKLSIFLACLHLFAISDDALRAEKLKGIGLHYHAVFFVLDRNTLAKFALAIVGGIAGPPLAFGLYAVITGSSDYAGFAQPRLIGIWIGFGLPMYLLPIAMVMIMKRLMRASWPIRTTHEAVGNDPAWRHRADFKLDIYILIFGLALVVAAVPLLAYNRIMGDAASLWFTLAPAATAVSLAVLIDFDVVDHGSARPRARVRPQTVVLRAACFAVLLGGIVSYLTATLTDEPIPTLVVYAVTAAFIGIMIGMRTDFNRNIRVIRPRQAASAAA